MIFRLRVSLHLWKSHKDIGSSHKDEQSRRKYDKIFLMIVMSETDLRSISIITIIILTMINFIPEDSNKIV